MRGFAGLGLFLFGIWLLEDGIRQVAGRTFKQLLRKHTNNPLKAIVVGMLATAVLQSSSVVSLILLALVGAGIIGLSNALGIVIGANLGTTFTGWVVTFVGFKVDIEGWVMPLVAVGSLLFVFTEGKYSRWASWGRTILGFGLLLFGLVMLKDAMGSVAEQVDLVQYAKYGTLPFALAGFVFTAIIQSSSATMVITLAALHSGVLDLHSAAALVIGADLGTTITVILGGLRGTAVKKQVALGQFLFNLITDVIALAALPVLLEGVLLVVGRGDPLVALVAFHSTFNLLGIAIFLPFLKPFARALERWTHNADDLPPGFERLRDIDPSVPLTATDQLEDVTRAFLTATCDLNRHALGFSTGPVNLGRQLVGERDFLDRYGSYKELEGQIMRRVQELSGKRMDPTLTAQLGRLQRGLLHAGQSAKELKDVAHHLKELRSAPDTASQDRLTTLHAKQDAIYDRLAELLELAPPGPPQEDMSSPALAILTALMELNRRTYEASLAATLNAAARGKGLPPKALTEDLNLTREVYSSTKRLLIGYREVLLNGKAGKAFDSQPER